MNYERIESRDGRIYWIEEGDKLYRNRFQAGSWQGSNWRFAQTLITNWHRCIDIGSNMACSAVLYSERFQQVECFEPTPLNIELWHLTINENTITNCNLYEHALGQKEFTTKIICHKRNGGHNHLDNADHPRWTGSKWITRKSQPRKRTTIEVLVKTLDSYQFTDVGFIKLDVEGYEKFVLEGAFETIKANRPILQLEIRVNQCRKFGYWAEDMIDWIRSLDYVVVSKKRGILKGQFKSYRNELLYDGQYYKGEMDLFFQPAEQVSWQPRDLLFV